jgi:hypothetical protein
MRAQRGVGANCHEATQWPADIGEQMAAVHRIYPIVDTAADPKLVELLKFVEDLRAGQ